ncbi:MAG: hypothetical protein JHD28_02900, partial [Bacteroidia bacterium]|nr:hypothetical protein [Bacteroidia bacterium]
FINSCKKDTTNFSKFDNYTASPEFAIPLFNTDLTVANFIEGNDNIAVGTDGLVSFVYREDSLYQYGLNDLIKFENNNTTTIDKNLGEIDIASISNSRIITLQQLTTDLDSIQKAGFDAIAGQTTIFPAITDNSNDVNAFNAFTEFTNVTFSNGWLILQVTNKLPVNLSRATINLYNLSPTQSLIGSFNYLNVAPGTSKSDSISLQNKTLNSSIGYSFAVLETNSSAPTAVFINYQDSITLKAIGKNLRAISGTAKFPSQEVVSASSDLDFSPTDPTQRLRKINFATGKLLFTTESTIPEPIELTIGFPGALKNGIPFPSQKVTIPFTGIGNTVIDSSIDISGIDFDLTQNISKPYNFIPINYSARVISSGAQVAFDSSNAVNIDIKTTSTSFEYAEGYFGTIDVPATSGDFIDLSFLKEMKSGLNLKDAQLKFIVNNSIGVPLRFNYNFIGQNDNGGTVDAQLQPFNIDFPLLNEVGVTKVTSQVYSNNNNNGKINELVSLPPYKIQIVGKVTANAVPDPTKNQFVKRGTGINVNVELDLPMAFSTSNFQLTDTTDFDIEPLKTFKEVTLGLNIDNGFPFEANVKAYFLNDANQVIDSISVDKVIASAMTDANGRTIQMAKSRSRIVLSKERLDKLVSLKAKKIRSVSSLITENNGTKTIRIYTDYKMKIAVGVIGKIDIK